MHNEFLHNPDLDGAACFLEAGRVGVLLVHGFSATTAEVRPLAAALHAQGFTVAAPLLPGHGTSPADLNQVRWAQWVEEAGRSYQLLKNSCDRVFVGGQSMGAVVALHLAGEHPEIAGVLCYAPAVRLAMGTADVIKLRIASLFVAEAARGSLDCAEAWQGYPGIPLKGALQLLRMQKALRPRLARIGQPVLILHGRKDTTIHPSVGAIIGEGVSSEITEFHWLENSSHPVILDRELDLITSLTIGFIKESLSRSPPQGADSTRLRPARFAR